MGRKPKPKAACSSKGGKTIAKAGAKPAKGAKKPLGDVSIFDKADENEEPTGGSSASGFAQGSALGSGEKPRKLRRWTTKDQVKKVFRTKLSSFDQLELDSMIGAESGLSPAQFIAREVRGNRNGDADTNISAGFWDRFFKEYNLTPKRFEHLTSDDDPLSNEPIGNDLLEALVYARHKDPKFRSNIGVINWCEYASACNVSELKLLMKATQEGPLVTRGRSRQLVVAILAYIGKHRLDLRFKNLWEQVNSDFDQVFTAVTTDKPAKANLRQEWLIGQENALIPLTSYESMLAVSKAVQEKRPVPVPALQSILNSHIGRLVFKAEDIKMRYELFVLSIDKRIRDLEFHSFSKAEMQGFTEVMLSETKRVMKGSPGFAKKKCTMQYLLATDFKVDITSANDEWNFRLRARIHTLAVSQGLLPGMPWEEHRTATYNGRF